MSVSTAIGFVSESLRALLLGEMQVRPTNFKVTILAPDEQAELGRINLFLYQVKENPAFKNADWQVRPDNPGVLAPPPLSVNLYYLVTAYAANDPATGNSTAHQLLGEAMRVFHEFPALPLQYLSPELQEAREDIRIIPAYVDMAELSHVWNTFKQPMRLSLMYEVSVVQLDLDPAGARTMPKRVRQIGTPGVQLHQPPLVNTLTPEQGQAGDTLTFSGQHLKGWVAVVKLLGQTLPVTGGVGPDGKLNGDAFTADLPAALQPGFYEVTVDVSRLFRRTFLIEVLP